ncbi:hypothetical protein EYF80_035463 [Liparis tanakae]|uniref:Uncharacterized protein n=1 Tax=Liparis tanakae TaxID=230148 RepID=A0A4Z2GNE0_9TELE|nr:hypothetical protein EYF80_035463 [Liparis tanakae]
MPCIPLFVGTTQRVVSSCADDIIVFMGEPDIGHVSRVAEGVGEEEEELAVLHAHRQHLSVRAPDGGVVTGGDAELFCGMGAQTPDAPPSVTVQQQVGRRVLLPDLEDLPVFRAHQDFTLRMRRRLADEEDLPRGGLRFMAVKIKSQTSHFASADGPDALHLPPRLQLEGSTPFHLLIPELHRTALLNFSTHGLSFPPVTMRPSLRVVYMENTGPATESIVCILPSSTVPTTPFLYIRAPPASVQNFTCLIPTDTNWESESGRNSTTKIRGSETVGLSPSCQRHTVMVCSGSTPTESSSFPVALKFT